ncbi:MAG: type II toxin-antitoxin system Phd/YefM family antitoxin [Candidatus Riflebacteria bacterium]|nr:type II toxin-antitoxin system Phd/YefM family antitoxin [Candidatus Riflebacteria bacterium]
MSNSLDIKPVTYLKANAADLLKHINETHRPIIITQNGEAKAVLQDPETFEATRKAFGLLKLISMGEEDIRKNKLINNEKVFKDIERKIRNNEK